MAHDERDSEADVEAILGAVLRLLQLGAGVQRAARTGAWNETLREDAALLGRLADEVRKHDATVAVARDGRHNITTDDASLAVFHGMFERVLQEFKDGLLEEEGALAYISATPGISPERVRQIATVRGTSASDPSPRLDLAQFIKDCGSVRRAATRLVDAFGGRSGSAVEKARRAYPRATDLQQLGADARGGFVSTADALRFALAAFSISPEVADEVIEQLRARPGSHD